MANRARAGSATLCRCTGPELGGPGAGRSGRNVLEPRDEWVSTRRCGFEGVGGVVSSCVEGFETQKGAVGPGKHANGELKLPFEAFSGGFIADEGDMITSEEVEELEVEALSEDDGVEEDLAGGVGCLAEQDFAQGDGFRAHGFL